MGESHAARVSYYELQVDSGPSMKQKSSGMTICTGTGSTSWYVPELFLAIFYSIILFNRHYNINRLTEQNLEEVLSIFSQLGMHLDREIDNELIEEICRRFNGERQLIGPPIMVDFADKLIFHPEALSLFKKLYPPQYHTLIPYLQRCHLASAIQCSTPPSRRLFRTASQSGFGYALAAPGQT